MGEPKKEWVSCTDAERMFKKSRRTIIRLSTQGLVERKRDSDREPWVYSVADLERYYEQKEADAETAQDSLLEQAYGMVGTLIGPAKQFCELLIAENEYQRRRIAHLEQRHDELITAREDLLNMKVERELAATQVAATEARKERAFKVIENQVAPKLLKMTGKAGKAGELLSSLDEGQVELLLNTDLITTPQKELLKGLLEERGVTVTAEESEKESA